MQSSKKAKEDKILQDAVDLAKALDNRGEDMQYILATLNKSNKVERPEALELLKEIATQEPQLIEFFASQLLLAHLVEEETNETLKTDVNLLMETLVDVAKESPKIAKTMGQSLLAIAADGLSEKQQDAALRFISTIEAAASSSNISEPAILKKKDVQYFRFKLEDMFTVAPPPPDDGDNDGMSVSRASVFGFDNVYEANAVISGAEYDLDDNQTKGKGVGNELSGAPGGASALSSGDRTSERSQSPAPASAPKEGHAPTPLQSVAPGVSVRVVTPSDKDGIIKTFPSDFSPPSASPPPPPPPVVSPPPPVQKRSRLSSILNMVYKPKETPVPAPAPTAQPMVIETHRPSDSYSRGRDSSQQQRDLLQAAMGEAPRPSNAAIQTSSSSKTNEPPKKEGRLKKMLSVFAGKEKPDEPPPNPLLTDPRYEYIVKKMEAASFTPSEIEDYLKNLPPTGTNAALEVSLGTKVVKDYANDPKYSEFLNMRQKHLPDDFIREKMAKSGIAGADIDGFIRTAVPVMDMAELLAQLAAERAKNEELRKQVDDFNKAKRRGSTNMRRGSKLSTIDDEDGLAPVRGRGHTITELLIPLDTNLDDDDDAERDREPIFENPWANETFESIAGVCRSTASPVLIVIVLR